MGGDVGVGACGGDGDGVGVVAVGAHGADGGVDGGVAGCVEVVGLEAVVDGGVDGGGCEEHGAEGGEFGVGVVGWGARALALGRGGEAFGGGLLLEVVVGLVERGGFDGGHGCFRVTGGDGWWSFRCRACVWQRNASFCGWPLTAPAPS